MSKENGEGLIPFPLNWIFVIAACVGLALILDAGLPTHPISSFFEWTKNLWNGLACYNFF